MIFPGPPLTCHILASNSMTRRHSATRELLHDILSDDLSETLEDRSVCKGFPFVQAPLDIAVVLLHIMLRLITSFGCLGDTAIEESDSRHEALMPDRIGRVVKIIILSEIELGFLPPLPCWMASICVCCAASLNFQLVYKHLHPLCTHSSISSTPYRQG